MKTLKYITNALTQFFKSLNSKTKENTANLNNAEYINNQFGINFKQDLTATKTPKSLFHQMYAVENETLFI
jgi:hypothetical protein